MVKKKKTSLDQVIESLAQEFSKIPNFDLTQTDPEANRLFNFILRKATEITAFKGLFLSHYIPATNRAIAEAKIEIKKSFYRSIIKTTDDEMKENHYEIIRLGYVGLFTKIENFHKELIVEIDYALNEGKGDLRSFIEKKFEYNFKNWHWDSTVKKINWINNRVKHDGSYPNDDPPFQLRLLPKDQKIRISKDEFSTDLDFISGDYFIMIIRMYSTFGLYKIFMEDDTSLSEDEEYQREIRKIEESIRKLISL